MESLECTKEVRVKVAASTLMLLRTAPSCLTPEVITFVGRHVMTVVVRVSSKAAPQLTPRTPFVQIVHPEAMVPQLKHYKVMEVKTSSKEAPLSAARLCPLLSLPGLLLLTFR